MESWFNAWVMGGGLIDSIIAVTLLEVIALLAYHYITKRGLAPRDYLLNVASGLCLMLALRSVLSGNSEYLIALLLMGSGIAHVADIALRLQQRVANH